ncbi:MULTISPECIES: PTS sugar transporter subunit IIB [Thermoactinomyces]|jgi:cellobiose PTS system EIIB component|uniref:PTS sugar transporter subunit IIB n=1 Tax=Thermoactinomyces vulgaris TaxID=2026 RepID=A0ABS0QLY7_THEVU|nr:MULTISPECIES: PTS cellobiose transporter subunit IIB [Thermoactinomyces]KFZ39794.1 PTS cellobiose transporter subunit IIB [Thermoactinomyces sp. Gus2-1]KYQ85613.1 PTS sugar transporter subunit IIB [Thermoactinomyces sp. AS95]MBA4552716.1 PTS sugar transporter subunit IIB [Thermoactinomyces vulgaris]MBA4597757.1 PTS sugar transporter subunit IIB [Thermoactinomyces vulgaris]MBH8584582.1 PTS sugar transporter subunit IIB [Thermoactinomyces sp. CICC 10735]
MKVLIVCAGGMSSAIVLKAIQLEAEKQGLPLTLKAIGAHELENELPDYDMALVAPQIRHRFVSLSDIGKKLNKKVQLIPSTGYTPMGAPSVIEMIKKELS